MSGLDYEIREGVPEDLRFIWRTWKSSFLVDSVNRGVYCRVSEGKHKPYGWAWDIMNGRVDHLLSKSDVWVACNPDDSDQIFGWIAVEDGRMHYMYVKDVYRGQGIAKELLDKAGGPKEFTHFTYAMENLSKKLGMWYTPSSICEKD
jgi:GNAT superfamily N-acetyltransferase